MMVIMGTSTLPGQSVGNNIHPADRCTWTQSAATGGGYAIADALFFPGAGGTGSEITITNPRLGFIGKSGRFVEIAS